MSILKNCVLSVSVAALTPLASAQCEPELLGSLAGEVSDIVRVGDLVYAANWGGGLVIYDVSNMTNPFVVGELKECGDPIEVAVSGNYAYLVNNGATFTGELEPGLVVVDVSDAASPTLVAALSLPGAPADLDVAGDYAFVGGASSPLSVVDISDPAGPVLVATGPAIQSEAHSVVADGTRLYVVDRNLGFVIFDVSDPASPAILSITRVGSLPFSVDISPDGSTAFVGTLLGTVVILDVSDASAPIEISSTPGFVGSMNGIELDGDRLYGFGPSRSGAMDVSNLAAPVFLNRFIPTPGAFGLEGIFSNGLGIIAGAYGGLISVDFSDPQTPIELARLQVFAQASYVRRLGNASYVKRGIGSAVNWNIVDTTDPSAPIVTGALSSSRALAIEDAIGSLDATVYDFTDSLNPVAVGEIAGLPYAGDAVIRDGIGYYVANSSVYIADLRAPASASVVGQVDLGRPASDMALSNELAIVVTNGQMQPNPGGVSIVDISDSQLPTAQGSLDFPNVVRDVQFVRDNLAVVLTQPENARAIISLVELSSMAPPTQVGSIEVSRYVPELSIVGGFVAIPGDPFGLDLIDVSNPASPAVAVHLPVPGRAYSVLLEDGQAHIGAGRDGYLIVDLFGCLPQPGCAGDIAGIGGSPDGIIDFEDFMALLGLIGECPAGMIGCLGDIADDFGTLSPMGGPDGQVSFGDFLALLGLVGPCS